MEILQVLDDYYLRKAYIYIYIQIQRSFTPQPASSIRFLDIRKFALYFLPLGMNARLEKGSKGVCRISRIRHPYPESQSRLRQLEVHSKQMNSWPTSLFISMFLVSWRFTIIMRKKKLGRFILNMFMYKCKSTRELLLFYTKMMIISTKKKKKKFMYT